MTITTNESLALTEAEHAELRVDLDDRRRVAAHSLAILTSGELDDGDRALPVAEQELADIDAALERLATGEYGLCSACGEPIASARLLALPLARRCIRCADG